MTVGLVTGRSVVVGRRLRSVRLIHEGRLLCELTHPHLVRGYEVTDTRDGPVAVMETLTGATLSRLIETDAPAGLQTEDVALLGRQLASALGYLHRHELVHLDLKPSNIICTGGKAILLDLSLAQPPGPCGPGAGTAEYMAPEQLTGDPVDTATDIFGLGGVLYRALTGRRPFGRSTISRSPAQGVDLAPLERPGANAALRDLVSGCLALSPEDRPNLDGVRRTLDNVLAEQGTAVGRPPPIASGRRGSVR